MISINASNASETKVTCKFYEGSRAIGCLIFLTSMEKKITHCIAQKRDSNASANYFPIFQTCNAKIDAGRYLLEVYDIERDGGISAFPVVKGNITLGISKTAVTVSRTSNFKASALSTLIHSSFL